MKTRIRISIRGAVQGFGFRPFIFRLAIEQRLNGFVRNTGSGVLIEAEGEKEILENFILKIKKGKPVHSSIHSMECIYLDPVNFSGFEIKESSKEEGKKAFISPDIAVCDDCLKELFDPGNRRYLYPFINCTNCGPRYTIIESIPYDRPNTSMKDFRMCSRCKEEYDEPFNRRFHAQPIACPDCGPAIALWNRRGSVISGYSTALPDMVRLLKQGKIIALKGLGGFQLIADACSDKAVKLLRDRKNREEKPFAVMVQDIESAERICVTDALERQLLLSPESPVVLLEKKSNPEIMLSEFVAPGNPYFGIMLPYTPLHHILMKSIRTPVIATSGNISEEPMCIDEQEALDRLGGIADYFLVHNRKIVRPVDDSVVRMVQGREMLIRRARGYAPLPMHLEADDGNIILALGAQLKNTVALKTGGDVFISQHIGDLGNIETEELLKKTIEDLSTIYKSTPATIVQDLHPGYTGSRISVHPGNARIEVQHHHAHAASCYYENQLSGSCLAVCWDGTGYGTDGSIWGGEFFKFDGEKFQHAAQLKQFTIPGNDNAVKDIKRSALGVLYNIYGENTLRIIKNISPFSGDPDIPLLLQMLEKKINSFSTSSAGRLFDAVSFLAGTGRYSRYEGEAAMELEFTAAENITDIYPFDIEKENLLIINWHPMIEKIIREIREKVDKPVIAARFHNTLIRIILTIALMLNEKKVVLSGGCFQNMYLLNGVIDKLRSNNFIPFWHQRIPTNDGGISFGQAAYTSKLLSKKEEDKECV